MPEHDQDFCTAFCAAHHCEPSEFVSRVFRLTLHRRALLFHKILTGLNKNFFRNDLDFLKEAGEVRSARDLVKAMKNYQADCKRSPNYLHDQLQMRVSCGRVMRLCNEVMDMTSSHADVVQSH